MFGPPFTVLDKHLLCLAHVEGEDVVLPPHCKVSDFLPIGCLIVVGDQAHHRCVVGKVNDGVGVHEANTYAPLRDPHVEDQRG